MANETKSTTGASSASALPHWWRWVVLGATFYMNAIVNGYAYTFGLLKIPMEADYPEVPQWLMASIGGAISSIYMFLAPFTIAASEHFGIRATTIGASLFSAFCFIICWLNGLIFHAGFILDLLCLGVGQGIALAFLYGPSVAILPSYFPIDQLAFAAGITNAGTSFGIIVYAFIANPLFSIYGWRGTMIIYAAFAVHGVIAGLAFVTLKSPQPKALPSTTNIELAEKGGEKADADAEVNNALLPPTPEPTPAPVEAPPRKTFLQVLRRFFDVKLLMQWQFDMILLAAAFSIIGYFVATLLVPGQAKKPEYGVHPLVAQYITVVFGVLNLTGRIVIGKIGDLGFKYKICTSYTLYNLSLIISAIAFLIFPHVMYLGNVAFISFIVIYGFAAAPIITMRSVLTTILFGKANASASYGWFLCAQGSLQMLGFIIPAELNVRAGPVYAYMFAAIAFILAAAACAVTGKPFFAARQRLIEDMAKKDNK